MTQTMQSGTVDSTDTSSGGTEAPTKKDKTILTQEEENDENPSHQVPDSSCLVEVKLSNTDSIHVCVSDSADQLSQFVSV